MSSSTRTECVRCGASMPLSLARSGDQVVCVSVEGSVGSRRHLNDLGILPGTRMQVVSGGSQPGPVVINVRGAKLMLGRGMAHRIMVRPD